MNRMEEGFSNYLESKKADKSFDWFYSQIKDAFVAGFICGGGKMIESDKVIEIYPKENKNEE